MSGVGHANRLVTLINKIDNIFLCVCTSEKTCVPQRTTFGSRSLSSILSETRPLVVD